MSINNLRATIVHFTWDFIRHPQKHRGGKQKRGGTGRRKRERERVGRDAVSVHLG